MSRSGKIKLTSYVVAAVAVLIGYIIFGFKMSANYKSEITNSYTSAITDLANYAENITLDLEKERYAADSTQMAVLANRLSVDSACAKIALKQLPVSEEISSDIYKFLSQTGDFSLYLSKKSAKEELSDNDLQSLDKLYSYSVKLSDKINDISAVAGDVEHLDYWNSQLKQGFVTVNNTAKTALSAFDESLSDIAEVRTDYPKLIYDGPFSDHMLLGTADYLKNDKMISADTARQKAADILGVEKNKTEYINSENGSVECYIIKCGEKTTAITKHGGHLLYMNDERTVAKREIEPETAVNVAKKYLKDKFSFDFAPSYYMIDNNICVVNLAYEKNGVIYYPDLVKVGVSLENGEIMSVEAAGFIMNHDERRVNFTKSESEAKAKLSNNLKVESVNKCVINLGTDKEYSCYEFTCKGKSGEDILVYIDGHDLTERNILILTKSDGGTLAQ